jgi:hypothetical protein
MMTLIRKKGFKQLVAILMVFSFSTWAMASGLTGARVIPSSKVTIYDGAKQVGVIGNEAPLPEGKILSSNETFGVQLDGIYLVATEKTKVGIRSISGGQDIFVQEGRVYFSIGAIQNILSFSTPQDSVTIQNVIVKASTSAPMVKGYVSYQDDQMEVAVLEGGQLMAVGANGQQIIEPGNKLMVQKAQANLGGGGAGAGGLGGPGWAVIGITTAAAVSVPIVFSNTKSDAPTSPFQP